MKEETRLRTLIERKSHLESKYFEAQQKENEKIRNLGWGSGMRGYKRMASLNLSRSQKIEEKISAVDEEIATLKEAIREKKAKSLVLSEEASKALEQLDVPFIHTNEAKEILWSLTRKQRNEIVVYLKLDLKEKLSTGKVIDSILEAKFNTFCFGMKYS